MCEYSGRLVAWLDQELPDQEATNVEWHVRHCAECWKAVDAYQEVSGAFLVCYEAAIVARPRSRLTSQIAGCVAAAVAILALVLLAQQQPQSEKLSVRLPSPEHAPAMAFEKSAPSAPAAAVRPQPTAPAPIHSQWIAEEPVVEVALPADGLFPPGAVPQGFSFIAEVRFQQ
jgi:Putative zinc-finger